VSRSSSRSSSWPGLPRLPDLPASTQTDLAILAMTGSDIEARSDHVVVRTRANPGYHWGNCVHVTDPGAVDDAPRWRSVFVAEFPQAGWVAIGLPRMPDHPERWTALGLEVERDDVLTTRTLPRQAPLADGYTARRLTGEDWEGYLARALADNAETGEHPADSFERYMRAQAATRRSLSEQGHAAFFGAFAGHELVADLGIVRCGRTARYQSVGTSSPHRRRGLATHLLGVAARWAGARGCDRWVIVTEATNPAGRVYRSVGFVPANGGAQVSLPSRTRTPTSSSSSSS
jgi:GNAT superfamily N-acetyltransferase